ncbi:MAG: hypothetical protein JWQ53_2876, partial [Klenkia sp.]|nr:hypothetical protein [Klenkia sp.]
MTRPSTLPAVVSAHAAADPSAVAL